jgi:CBS domain containing-hemolysin-like protein
VAWIVTLEDIIEEVFWEIRDETDKEIDEIRKIKDDTLVVESSVLAEEVLESLNLNLESIWLDQKEFEWETLSYIITEKLERFPKTWEIIEYEIIWDNEEKKEKLVLKFLKVDDSGTWNIEIKKVEI